ncbi:hypothetical protein KQX54_021160 [Cotesia glomerata]|uniref:Uncharacterized protein n=1 Tax=Cotesia glomerata TaxID=32391 RepID=A0AAV7J9Y2_COTGL|nr:hypothetical protein KQX54_021160 [Cotesia glomerata]
MSNAQRVKLRKECVKSVEECGTSKWLPVTLVIYGRIVLCCHGQTCLQNIQLWIISIEYKLFYRLMLLLDWS